ncbi:MAG: hypothetical protein M3Z96_00470 [Pseudomonadota bacterium]|nr:hypothetical protein [Pseudomonadota bacterium]
MAWMARLEIGDRQSRTVGFLKIIMLVALGFYPYLANATDLGSLVGIWNSDVNSENIEIRSDRDVIDDRFGQGRISSTTENAADILIVYQHNIRCWYKSTLLDDNHLRLANRTGPDASPSCMFGAFSRVVPQTPFTPPNVSCPSIAGTWYAQEYNEVITIKQVGCEISSDYTVKTHSGFLNYFELEGQAVRDKFEYTIKETYNNSDCTLMIYGKFTAIQQKQMVSHDDHTSGQCGRARDFNLRTTWVKH